MVPLAARDRALISIMVYSFARVGTVIQMRDGDYFVQGRRRWVRLHEKGGKEHDVPCHHRLDQCLHDYIEAAGISDDVGGYLFRSGRRKISRRDVKRFFKRPKSIQRIYKRFADTFNSSPPHSYPSRLQIKQSIRAMTYRHHHRGAAK